MLIKILDYELYNMIVYMYEYITFFVGSKYGLIFGWKNTVRYERSMHGRAKNVIGNKLLSNLKIIWLMDKLI